MCVKFSVIGKRVEKNSDVITAYRFVNLKDNKILDIPVSELKSFMSSHQVTNAYLDAYDNFTLIYQNIYHLPVFRVDGSVNTYYYKVILERLHNGKYLLGNVTGGIVESILPLYLFKFYNLNSPVGLIVDTPERCCKFTMCMDGSYKTEVIDINSVYNINIFKTKNYEKVNIGASYDVHYVLKECEYENRIYYFYDSFDLKSDISDSFGLPLTCSKLNGQLTFLYKSKKSYPSENGTICTYGYQLKSTPFDNADYRKLNKLSSMNHIGFAENHFMIGIDGITCLGKDFCNLHNESLVDYYNGLLLMSPDDAQIFQNNIKVGSQNDLIYCNLGMINIPDGIESVESGSLSFDFDSYYKRYEELIVNPSLIEDAIIPASVKSFSNNAFKVKESNSYYTMLSISKSMSLIVEEPSIAVNVINAMIHSGLKFKSIVVSGNLNLNLNSGLVKRICDYGVPVISDNFKFVIGRVDKHLNVKCVGDKGKEGTVIKTLNISKYSVRPYASMDKNTRLMVFESVSEFNKVFKEKVVDLNKSYFEVKNLYSTAVKKDIAKDIYKGYEMKVKSLLNDYKSCFNMISHSVILDGEINEYHTLCTSMNSRINNLETLLNEKMRLFKLDMEPVWKNRTNK